MSGVTTIFGAFRREADRSREQEMMRQEIVNILYNINSDKRRAVVHAGRIGATPKNLSQGTACLLEVSGRQMPACFHRIDLPGIMPTGL